MLVKAYSFLLVLQLLCQAVWLILRKSSVSVSLLKQLLLLWLGETVSIYAGNGTNNHGLACPECSTQQAIDLLQMHFGSRQPNQQTKAKQGLKRFLNCPAKWVDVDFFLQETDELLRLIIIFVPLGSSAGPDQSPHIMF